MQTPLVLLAVLTGAAMAGPITYNITFEYTFGGETLPGSHGFQPAGLPVSLPTTSFFYNPDAQPSYDLYGFSSTARRYGFEVLWSGNEIFITNDTVTGTPVCAGGLTGSAAILNMLTNCPSATWDGAVSPDFASTFSFKETDAEGTIWIYGRGEAGPDGIQWSGGTFQTTGNIPEPSTFILIGIGLICFRARSKR